MTSKERFPRRKTETPFNIEKIISKTLVNQGFNKAKKDKSYSRFQRQQLNDV